jgi:hypothetical protein
MCFSDLFRVLLRKTFLIYLVVCFSDFLMCYFINIDPF